MSASSSSHKLRIALLFLAPNLLGFLVFTLGPIIISLCGSFTTWSLLPSVPLRFIGVQNYIDLFSDPNFYFYFYNTIYLLLAMPFSLAGSLFLAVILSQKLDLRGKRSSAKLAIGSGGVCVF